MVNDDIVYGYATIVAGRHKGAFGWFLPGGLFTKSQAKAKDMAVKINWYIANHGGLK